MLRDFAETTLKTLLVLSIDSVETFLSLPIEQLTQGRKAWEGQAKETYCFGLLDIWTRHVTFANKQSSVSIGTFVLTEIDELFYWKRRGIELWVKVQHLGDVSETLLCDLHFAVLCNTWNFTCTDPVVLWCFALVQAVAGDYSLLPKTRENCQVSTARESTAGRWNAKLHA